MSVCDSKYARPQTARLYDQRDLGKQRPLSCSLTRSYTTLTSSMGSLTGSDVEYTTGKNCSESESIETCQLYKGYAWLEIIGLHASVDTDNLKEFFEFIYPDCYIVKHQIYPDEKHTRILLKYHENDAKQVFTEYKWALGRRKSYNGYIWKMKPIDKMLLDENPYYSVDKSGYVLKISGIKGNVSEHRLITSTCNPKEGIAGPPKHVDYNRSTKTATLSFENSQDAEALYQKITEGEITELGPNVYCEKLFSSCVPTYPLVKTEDCFFVKGLPKGTQAKDIERYFREADKGCRLKIIKFGTTYDTALVYFHQMPNYKKVFKAVCTMPLGHEMIEVEHVYKSFAIEIHCPQDILYSDVSSFLKKYRLIYPEMKCLPKYNGCVIVQFSSPQEMQDMLQMGHKYNIHGRQIYLQVHHECIGKMPPEHDARYQAVIISPEKSTAVENEIIDYINKNGYYEVLESEMALLDTEVEMEKDRIILRSHVNTHSTNSKQTLLEWEKNIDRELQRFLNQFHYQKKQISEAARNFNRKKLPSSNNTVVLITDSDNNVIIHGLKDQVIQAAEEVDLILEREERLVTKSYSGITELQLELLEKINMLETIENKYEDMEVTDIKSKGQIKISVRGVDEEVQSALCDLKRAIEDMEEGHITLGNMLENLSTEFQLIVNDICQGKHCIYHFQLNELTLISPSAEETENIISLIESCSCEEYVEIPQKSNRAANRESKHWKKFEKDLKTQCKLSIYWGELVDRQISYAAVGDRRDVNEIKSQLLGYLDFHEDRIAFMEICDPLLAYIKQSFSKQLSEEALEKDVELIFPNKAPGIVLCGPSLEMEQCIENIKKSLKMVQFSRFEMRKPGLPKLFASADGKSTLQRYENVFVQLETVETYNYQLTREFDVSDITSSVYEKVYDVPILNQKSYLPKITFELLKEKYNSTLSDKSTVMSTPISYTIPVGKMTVTIINETDALNQHQGGLVAITEDQTELKGHYSKLKANLQKMEKPNMSKGNIDLQWKNANSKVFDAAIKGDHHTVSLPLIESEECTYAQQTDTMIECFYNAASKDSKAVLKVVIVRVESELVKKHIFNQLYISTNAEAVAFQIFGTDEETITQVKEYIINKCDEICNEKTLGSDLYGEFVRNLGKDELRKIMTFEQRYPVKITVTDNDITIEGLLTDCIEIKNEIENMKAVYEERMRSTTAEMVHSFVQWYYTKDKRDYAFSMPVSFMIEKLYHVHQNDAKNEKHTIIGENKLHADISFKDRVIKYHTQSTMPIKRKQLSEDNLPDNWSNELEKEISPYIEEYERVKSTFSASLGREPNICRITRIQNPLLHKRYEVKKVEMIKENKSHFKHDPEKNEKLMWHGTSADAIQEINSTGFNRSFCGKNATAYGKGVYFAVNASYSDSTTYSRPDNKGWKHIYMCRVLTGEYTKGDPSMIVPPTKGFKGFFYPSVRYDTVVDKTKSPSMHVCFYDDQAYPKYLIKYR